MKARLTSTVLNCAIAGVNRLLCTDPVTMKNLQALRGKTLCVHLSDWDQYLCVDVQSSGVCCTLACEEAEAVTYLQGRSAAVLAAMTWQKPGLPPGLEVAGDLQVLQQWQSACQHLEIDWGGLLAPCLGDALGQGMADVAVDVVRGAKRFWRRRFEDALIYAQDEIHGLPSMYEAQSFYDDVDRLRDDVARACARWDRLRAAASEGEVMA